MCISNIKLGCVYVNDYHVFLPFKTPSYSKNIFISRYLVLFIRLLDLGQPKKSKKLVH